MIKVLIMLAIAAVISSFSETPKTFNITTFSVQDTTKPYVLNGKRVSEREMDSVINLCVKRTMDSLRARRYIVKQ